MTSCLLYSLAESGFHIVILQFGMNVIMDVINLSVEIHEQAKQGRESAEYIDLSDGPLDEIEG